MELLLKFSHYQSIFNLESTEEWCRTVLDEIAPKIKDVFNRFAQSVDASPENSAYLIHTSDAPLT
ncbi:hypothetical protein, partial [Neobacillus vireti]|uniref:hypothetical protein n=1 Tax=Neobacillus vireti TaxID=220686 RepID=UPI003000E5BF